MNHAYNNIIIAAFPYITAFEYFEASENLQHDTLSKISLLRAACEKAKQP